MNVSETKSEGLLREYQIVITAAEIDAEVSKKLEEIATTVKMPGFRPGKVPMSVVKSRFSDQVRGDAIKAALDEGARQAIEGNDLRLASQPQVDIKSYEDGKDLEASLACEVMPAITIPDLGKVSVDRPKIDSDPKEVEETLGRIADENRPTAPIAKARAAKSGDVAMIDFIGRIDGEDFDGGTAEGHSLELGSNSFIPGFEDGIVGAKPGTTIDVPVTFPEDYQAAHLAGKLAVFEVKLNELHEKADASIDDELATRLGFENLDGLKGAIAEQINGQHQTALRQMTKKNVLDALAEGDAFDVPPSLFKQEYESVARAMNPKAAEQDHDHDHDHGHDHDHDHGHDHPAVDEGMDDDAKAEAEAVATRRVRLGLLITEIGRENNIEVTEEDTRRAVFEEARRYPGQEQMVLEYFQKNPQATQQIAGPIFEDKVIDFILEMAKVTDVTIDTDTLYAAPEEAAPAKKAAAKKPVAKKAAAKKPAAKKAAAKKPAAKK
ncbi:trigger factor [Candidatus Ponderosibacter sp. Uisw_141_02]|uniref:trigger factor n=1 Tax=Candidatus Ponderosibacter sp. Uisw_141_02 TaxID=3231000 RepID=UPI003D48587E